MVRRSENDSILADHLGTRRDIPRHLFQQLIAKASDDARKRMTNDGSRNTLQVSTAIADATGALHSTFGPASKGYFAAKKTVKSLQQYGDLGERKLYEFAVAHKLEEATIAMSLLGNLPVDVVERSLTNNRPETLLMLSKALNLSWETTMALLFLAAPDHRISSTELCELNNNFDNLSVDASREVLTFYQTRKQQAAGTTSFRPLPELHQRTYR
jgi:hypothetical protein